MRWAQTLFDRMLAELASLIHLDNEEFHNRHEKEKTHSQEQHANKRCSASGSKTL
jgi:hypothetical protein